MPLDQTRSPSGDHQRVWALRPVLSAWALTIGLDLFFNAGVFMPLFDQEREPSLLPDEVLFRRPEAPLLAVREFAMRGAGHRLRC